MKQIAILSGKGGTGKTSITASLAFLINNKILVDCDVDAPDLHIILEPEILRREEFKGRYEFKILPEKCTSCNKCYEVCRFNAIIKTGNKYTIDEYECDSCGFCFRVCPEKAIIKREKVSGEWFISNTRAGKFIYARLYPGEENTGKLVTLIRYMAKREAEDEKREYILIDGPPGMGCPVISTLAGVDLVIAVTEPTLSGLSDLKRLLKTADHFEVKSKVIINKYNINKEVSHKIENFCNENGYEVVARIPFDSVFMEAMINRKSVIEYAPSSEASKILTKIAREIQ